MNTFLLRRAGLKKALRSSRVALTGKLWTTIQVSSSGRLGERPRTSRCSRSLDVDLLDLFEGGDLWRVRLSRSGDLVRSGDLERSLSFDGTYESTASRYSFSVVRAILTFLSPMYEPSRARASCISISRTNLIKPDPILAPCLSLINLIPSPGAMSIPAKNRRISL